jgi:hypothetical protein
MMLKSAPVRATAFTNAIRLTRRKPRCAASRRICVAKAASADAASPRRAAGRVSGIASHATAEARTDVTAYAR